VSPGNGDETWGRSTRVGEDKTTAGNSPPGEGSRTKNRAFTACSIHSTGRRIKARNSIGVGGGQRGQGNKARTERQGTPLRRYRVALTIWSLVLNPRGLPAESPRKRKRSKGERVGSDRTISGKKKTGGKLKKAWKKGDVAQRRDARAAQGKGKLVEGSTESTEFQSPSMNGIEMSLKSKEPPVTSGNSDS